MPKTRVRWTRFSKGELSPLLEGSPDLATYYEGAATIENFKILRQGGIRRWEGTRFVNEVKDSTKDTILWPFEFSVDDAYILEVGDLYIRVYKNKAPVLLVGVHVEIVTTFVVADIRSIHMTQSADVLFTFHSSYQQRKLSRVSDTSWALNTQDVIPPPTFAADTDVAAGVATLTPGATTGDSVTFTASNGVFQAGDVGRQLIAGAARAEIITYTNATHVVANVLDDFPDTSAIPAGSWFLRLSPQFSLDPNKSAPVGSVVTVTMTTGAFRFADIGKYIKIYGGVIKLEKYISTNSMSGRLLSPMGDTTLANPGPAEAGAWTLEVASWSDTRGWPRTGEFFQGRLAQASTLSQPTTFWESDPDDYDNYAVGLTDANAIEYTIASRQVNRLEWLTEHNKALLIGTTGSEIQATGSGTDNALITGDSTPQIDRLATNGVAPIQPVVARKSVLYIDRSRRKVMQIGFDLENDGQTDKEISVGAEHITESGVRLGPLAYEKRLNPRIYFSREDGVGVGMTFFPEQKVVAFSRRTTPGEFGCFACIPNATGGDDQTWTIATRTINGQTKRFVEMFEPNHELLSERAWTALYTDCAEVFTAQTGTIMSGLDRFEGESVDVVKNGSYLGAYDVLGGDITLQDDLVTEDVVEVGLHYESTLTTMRPSVPGQVLEGLPRSWDSLFARFKDTIGGTINGEAIDYSASPLDEKGLYTGDVKVTVGLVDIDGRVTITQPQPYPMTCLMVAGTLSLGDRD